MAQPVPDLFLTDGELRLRPPLREEAALYAQWWSDPEVAFAFCSEPRSAEEIAGAFPELEAEARSIGHWIDFVIELDGTPVGSIWLSRWDLEERTAELNLLIGEPELRGQGIGRRAIRLVCRWAFSTMDLRRIDLCPREDHVRAIRSYLGLGARDAGYKEEVASWNGETVCFRHLYFLPEDFEAAQR